MVTFTGKEIILLQQNSYSALNIFGTLSLFQSTFEVQYVNESTEFSSINEIDKNSINM